MFPKRKKASEEKTGEVTKAESSNAKKPPKVSKEPAGDSGPAAFTLRIPKRFLQGLGIVAAIAIVGFGVWYFAIRDTGPSAAEKRAEAQKQAAARAAAAAALCQQQVGGLLSAEEDLDGRLSGSGMTEADYISRVGDVSAAYRQISIKDLKSGCLTNVGIPTESAMNAYIDASNTWNNCITDFNCNVDSITPELQGKWAKATVLINQAKQGLVKLQTAP